MTKATRVKVPAPTPAWRAPLPSRDGQPLDSPFVWMQEKNEADQKRTGVPAHLWCVRGKFYDLSKFKHPGGQVWLDYTRGGDVTVAYESHHLNMGRCDKVLAKYLVEGESKKEAPGEFTFAEKGFFRTLKARVREELGDQTGPTAATWGLVAGFVGAWAVCFAGACALPSTWGWASAVAAGVLLLGIWGLGHNFFHQAAGLRQYVFDLTAFSSANWRISHAISHHLYANTDIDVEVSSLEPYLHFLSNRPRNPVAVYLVYHVLAFNVFLVNWVRRIVFLATGRERFMPESLLSAAQLAALVYFQGWAGAGRFYVMHGLATYLLLVTSFTVHRTEHAWTEGDSAGAQDYGEHVVKTTHDHSMGMGLAASFFFFAGLNNHVLHHLFPTVDHSRLHSIHPILVRTCKDFGIPYTTHRFSDLFWSTLRRHDMFAR